MGEEELIPGNNAGGSQSLLSLNNAEEMENGARFERNYMRGDTDIALAAGGALMKMSSRTRRHRNAEHGDDRDDENRRAKGTGHAVNRNHRSGGFILGSGFFVSVLVSAGGSSVSSNFIEVSAEYFW